MKNSPILEKIVRLIFFGPTVSIEERVDEILRKYSVETDSKENDTILVSELLKIISASKKTTHDMEEFIICVCENEKIPERIKTQILNKMIASEDYSSKDTVNTLIRTSR